jgi:hypothetical protein
VAKVETPIDSIFPYTFPSTFPVKFPTKLGAVIIPVVFTFPVMASTENPFPVRGSHQLVKNNMEVSVPIPTLDVVERFPALTIQPSTAIC